VATPVPVLVEQVREAILVQVLHLDLAVVASNNIATTSYGFINIRLGSLLISDSCLVIGKNHFFFNAPQIVSGLVQIV
jgi:hypothetical protein